MHPVDPEPGPRLIGLYSPCEQCGKSTLADMIAEDLARRGLGVDRNSFSVPIKAMVEGLLRSTGMDEERIGRHVRGDLKAEPIAELGGVTSRHLQATLGTPWARRMIHPDFWIHPVASRLSRQAAVAPDTVSLFEDLRFPNEYDMLSARSGVLVRITRPEAVAKAETLRRNGKPEDIERLAYSEGLLEGREFDFDIDNDGTLIDLASWAETIVETALERSINPLPVPRPDTADRSSSEAISP